MNRILTTIVQLFLVLGAFACLRLMWQDLKHDIAEIKNDLFNRKQLQDPEQDLKLLKNFPGRL